MVSYHKIKRLSLFREKKMTTYKNPLFYDGVNNDNPQPIPPTDCLNRINYILSLCQQTVCTEQKQSFDVSEEGREGLYFFLGFINDSLQQVSSMLNPPESEQRGGRHE